MATHRSLLGLDGVNFFTAAMQTGFGAFVTVHLVADHWTTKAIGFALTVSTVSSLVSQVPAGAFIDSIENKRRAVWLGTIAVGIGALLLSLTSAEPEVYLAQVLQGLGSSLIGPGIAAISLVLVGHAKFSERVGRNARFAAIGNGLTAGVMGLFGAYFAPTAVFLLSAVLSIPTLLALSFIGPERAEETGSASGKKEDDGPKFTWNGLVVLFLDRRLLIFASCIVLFFASSAAMLPGVAVRATRQYPEVATLIVAATILLPQAIVAAISPWVGRTAERSGRRPMLLLGWGLLPLQGLLYATLSGPYAVAMGLALNGISGAVFGVMMALVAADLTRGTNRFNVVLGTFGVAISIGASLSTSFAGLTATAFGGQAAYLGLALAGLCGVLLLWVGMPETRPAMNPTPSSP